MQSKNVHWFPGHMVKALREVETRMSVVDVIIEILDARAPFSSRNPHLAELRPEKRRLLVLAKADLADEKITNMWVQYYQKAGFVVLALNLNSSSAVSSITKKAEEISAGKREKEIRKGMRPQPIRAMIIGTPNVGKSTLINKLAHKQSATVGNKPGVTKAQQWIKVGDTFELLDTPGILPPDYDNKNVALNLASIGSIKQEILPITEVVGFVADFMKANYPANLIQKYEMKAEELATYETILDGIAKRRGLMIEGQFDRSKAELTLLKDFQNGTLGRITLEKPTL